MNSEYDPQSWARREEDRKIKELKDIVDPICRKITKREINEEEARELIAQARLEASFRVPDSLELYDLIYESRFERLIEQFLRT